MDTSRWFAESKDRGRVLQRDPPPPPGSRICSALHIVRQSKTKTCSNPAATNTPQDDPPALLARRKQDRRQERERESLRAKPSPSAWCLDNSSPAVLYFVLTTGIPHSIRYFVFSYVCMSPLYKNKNKKSAILLCFFFQSVISQPPSIASRSTQHLPRYTLPPPTPGGLTTQTCEGTTTIPHDRVDACWLVSAVISTVKGSRNRGLP